MVNEVVNRVVDSLDISEYLNDPLVIKLTDVLKERKINRKSEHILREVLKNEHTTLPSGIGRWLIEHLPLFHTIVNNQNGRLVFLKLRYPNNCKALAEEIGVHRRTVEYWFNVFLKMGLVNNEGIVYNGKYQIEFKRKEDNNDCSVLLDYFCDMWQKKEVLTKNKQKLDY